MATNGDAHVLLQSRVCNVNDAIGSTPRLPSHDGYGWLIGAVALIITGTGIWTRKRNARSSFAASPLGRLNNLIRDAVRSSDGRRFGRLCYVEPRPISVLRRIGVVCRHDVGENQGPRQFIQFKRNQVACAHKACDAFTSLNILEFVTVPVRANEQHERYEFQCTT